jgi:uncharacterized protein (TIGR03546 family)
MLFIFKQIVNFLKLLHAEGSDRKIAIALVLGFFSATSPLLSLQGFLFLSIAIFFRIQFAAFLLSWLLFALLFIPLAPLLDQIGHSVLSIEALNSAYTWAQKDALLGSARFYNTLVMGGLVLGLVLAFPLYFSSIWALKTYRSEFVERFKRSKAYHFLKASFLFKIVGFYEKYKAL